MEFLKLTGALAKFGCAHLYSSVVLKPLVAPSKTKEIIGNITLAGLEALAKGSKVASKHAKIGLKKLEKWL